MDSNSTSITPSIVPTPPTTIAQPITALALPYSLFNNYKGQTSYFFKIIYYTYINYIDRSSIYTTY